MSKWYSVFISLFLLQTLQAEGKYQSVVDSLKSGLSRCGNDTNKVKVLDQISFAYSSTDPDEGLRYAIMMEKLSAELNWKKGLANANAVLGVNYVRKCDYNKAIYHNLKSLALYRELGLRKCEGAILANICQMYIAQSDYAKALEHGLMALTILEEVKDTRSVAIVHENIGSIFQEQGNYTKTMFYYAKAQEEYKETGDKPGLARNLGNQGIVLNALGEYRQALKYHLLALRTNNELGEKNSVQVNLANIGNTYSNLKQLPLALSYHLRALAMSKKLKDSKSIAINLGNAGETYYLMAKEKQNHSERMKLLDKAITYLKSAKEICNKINFRGPYIEFCGYLSESYQLAGEYKLALDTYKDLTSVKDSVFSKDVALQIASLESKRDVERRDREIALKNKQLLINELESKNKNRESTILLIGIALLLCVIFILHRSFRVYSRHHKKTMSDIANLQSHEVRAPLARILGLVQLFDHDNASACLNKNIISYINISAVELDDVIRKIVLKTDTRKTRYSIKPTLLISWLRHGFESKLQFLLSFTRKNFKREEDVQEVSYNYQKIRAGAVKELI